MNRKARMEGGFAYRNAGMMENCYASVKIGGGKSENAGLAYDNSGEVLHCFTRSVLHKWKRKENGGKKKNRKQKDGLFVINNGNVSQSFFLIKKEKKLKKYRDRELGLTIEQAEPGYLKENYDWDYNVFEEKNASDMEFSEEAWQHTIRYVEEQEEPGTEEVLASPRRRRENLVPLRGSTARRVRKTFLQMRKASAMRKKAVQAGRSSVRTGRTPVHAEKMPLQEKGTNVRQSGRIKMKERTEPVQISSEEEFLDFIDRVNRGEAEAAFGSFELICDLDFHGKTIPSAGCDRQHPFSGMFDGKGHAIRGFVLNGKDMAEIGLFGHLEGIVQNLSIDCIVKGKNCPMTASFCAYNGGEIHCCESVTEICAGRYAGMFVGENKGVIERCCVSGKSRGVFFFWLWPLLPFAVLTVGILVNPPRKPQEYVPIMADAQIVPNEEEEIKKRENENKASYEVPKELVVDKASMTARSEPYVIKNPDRGGNYDFVAVLYMKDSAGNNVEVYRSGRIPLGYHIEQMKISPPHGTTLSEGVYDAEIVFSFYHHNSGEKGMVDSRVPISIEIR